MNFSPTLHIDGATLPVFPLADFVLFPRVIAPLHIFEPRYRQMIEHSLDGQGVFVMAISRRHQTLADGKPCFWGIGCACTIVDYEKELDGRYNILVEGITRVQIEEVESNELYRQVSASVTDFKHDVISGSRDMQVRDIMLRRLKELDNVPEDVVDQIEDLDLDMLLHLMAFHYPAGVDEKLKMLYTPDLDELCNQVITAYESLGI